MNMLPTFPHRWLNPLPGLSRDAEHRYRLGSHVFPVSVTGVLGALKTSQAMERIEATRADWEPRGNTVHRALELAATVPGWHPDDWPECWPWIDWIWPLLTHPLWNDARLIASEMGLYSLDLNLAGTFDGAYMIRTPRGWRRILFDLKTQARKDAGAYDTRPQLGGYLRMALEHGITFDGAATLWARPGKTALKTFAASECLDVWDAALGAFRGLCGSGEKPLLLP